MRVEGGGLGGRRGWGGYGGGVGQRRGDIAGAMARGWPGGRGGESVGGACGREGIERDITKSV